jgi:hypothetical protein
MNTNRLPSSSASSTPTHPQPAALRPTDATSQGVQWLWPQRLPVGKLTLLEGSPGSGTSLLALTLAACLSTGSAWPDGTPCPQGNVLFIAAHDDDNDTLLPRLEALGANPSHIIFLPRICCDPTPSSPFRTRPWALPEDLAFLKTFLRQMEIRLLILDPFSAIPGLRQSLLDLVHLAQRSKCAILLTDSLRQAPANPLHPSLPPSPVRTAARSCLLLAPDPTDERKHLLLTTKHPLCASVDILSYTIIVTEGGIPLLHWLGPQPTSHLTRLATAPLRSPQRQAILRFLHDSPTACTLSDILKATSYDQDAGRKLIGRMRLAGELVSPARGLYTTSGHPCLASDPAPLEPPSPSPTSTSGNSPVTNVTNVTNPLKAASPGPQSLSLSHNRPVTNVTNVPE